MEQHVFVLAFRFMELDKNNKIRVKQIDSLVVIE